ncbi:odorant receptor 131-2-like [Pseudophryne corroboree]|uniref:odorant receptor 131-2-like n=1 Tax=Pseudophryne corroboree TaxID=495146 RepID=UPI003081CDD0
MSRPDLPKTVWEEEAPTIICTPTESAGRSTARPVADYEIEDVTVEVHQDEELNISRKVVRSQSPMVDPIPVPWNTTQLSFHNERIDQITRTVLVILTILMTIFLYFRPGQPVALQLFWRATGWPGLLYFITVLLNVFFSSPQMRENARYVLFAHMLINDAFYLAMGMFILLSAIYYVYLPLPICCIMLSLAASSFRVTPYNLAVMSLERYIAICFPLRHLEFCTAGRAKSAVFIVWVVGFAPSIADICVIAYYGDKTVFSFHVLCNLSMLKISPIQNIIRSFIHIFSFTMVAIIILLTYIKVMLVARKFGPGGSSAFRAGKTVLLHAVQLMLCMVSFISSLAETYISNYIKYTLLSNFIIFTCLPRFLSPVIYGIRDEAFSKYIRRLY